MDEDIILILPTVHERDKPVLFDAQGDEIQISRKVGFAGHPDVPTWKIKGAKP